MIWQKVLLVGKCSVCHIENINSSTQMLNNALRAKNSQNNLVYNVNLFIFAS